MKIESLETKDPKAHARNIQQMLTEVIEHVRKTWTESRIQGASAFRNTAEVLIRLRTAYEHYERGAEKAMR